MKAILATTLTIASAVVSAQRAVPARTLRLPDAAYEYAHVPLPAHLANSAAADNTPADNPITNGGATLGRVLFYDTALSVNGATSCSSCHRQQHAFADPNRVSRGFDGRFTDRHAMNLTGLRYYPSGRFFWDERGDTLEDTVLRPVRNPIEMGEDPARLPQKLAALPYYPELFRGAFGGPAITEDRIAKALAQFLRSLVSYRSRFDEGMAKAGSEAGTFENFTRQENHGKALFLRNCSSCHFQVKEAPFALVAPANNGTGLDPRSTDGGLADITLNALDAGRFKSPTLRNVEVAGPYMHDGSLATLEEVVEHYSGKFNRHPNLDFRMQPLKFTESEKAALVAFLKTLTDLAFLTDPRFSDPFDPRGADAPPIGPPTPPLPSTTPMPRRGDIEAVVARVMSFDADRDGRVTAPELPDRMLDIVRRGDRNGDAALEAAEVRAIAFTSPEVGVGLRRPIEVHVTDRPTVDPGLAGLIDDLSVPPDRRGAVLVALAQAEADTTSTLTASLETFRGEVLSVLTEVQLATLDQGIQEHGRTVRRLLAYMAAPCCLPTLSPPVPVGRLEDLDVGRIGLQGDALGSVRTAFNRHLERLRVLATSVATDRGGLLRHMRGVLTDTELADLAASLDRHRMILTPANGTAQTQR